MDRRNLLKYAVSALVGLFVGKRSDAIQVDTTSMHNKEWRTSTIVDEVPPVEHIEIECDTLHIECRSSGCDGYPTFAHINGLVGPYKDANGNEFLEQTIEFTCKVMEEPQVKVEYLRRSEKEPRYSNVTANIKAKHILLTVGILKVETHPRRGPCLITINGLEPRVKDLHVRFEEGVACWVDMTFLPTELTRPELEEADLLIPPKTIEGPALADHDFVPMGEVIKRVNDASY